MTIQERDLTTEWTRPGQPLVTMETDPDGTDGGDTDGDGRLAIPTAPMVAIPTVPMVAIPTAPMVATPTAPTPDQRSRA